eukprot:304062-Chlamydomonas_euryale.AAC.8
MHCIIQTIQHLHVRMWNCGAYEEAIGVGTASTGRGRCARRRRLEPDPGHGGMAVIEGINCLL